MPGRGKRKPARKRKKQMKSDSEVGGDAPSQYGCRLMIANEPYYPDGDALTTTIPSDVSESGSSEAVEPNGSSKQVPDDHLEPLCHDGDDDADSSKDIKIDTRLPYRQGYPYLPILPVITSYEKIPKDFSPSGVHITNIRNILQGNRVVVKNVEVLHRMHKGTAPSASTLTLCVQSEESNNHTWPAAIHAVHIYLTMNGLTPTIEIIDSRAFHGIFTLPILPTEKPGLLRAIKRRHPTVVQILEEEGVKFASVDFFYRGLSGRWKDCRLTCLIGVMERECDKQEQMEKRWDVAVPRVQKAVGKDMGVEIYCVGREDEEQ